MHVLTATGAAFALLALIDAAHGEWQRMFVWLGVALFVDTIDGPLARRVRVTEVLPRWSGERLDLIVDYLTYVGVPAFALAESDLLPAPFRVAAAIAILLSSLFHMADLGSKTGAGYFVGFPAIWNVVLLYLFAFTPPPVVSLADRRLLRAADLRPHPCRASVSRGGAAPRDAAGDGAVGGGGDRRRRQSVSLAAMGQDPARSDRSRADGGWPVPRLARASSGIDLRLALGY